ncbi:pectinesterase family protein [Gracilimonas sp.]|uniref:pectinesterase family protein n=1 Tax=Gracilimonas sp. TaxID=1974203 RepID=UPI0032EAEAB4
MFILLIPTLLMGFQAVDKYDFVVAKDGSGDFTSVQDAIDAVPVFRDNETVIYIRKGVYKEKLTLPPNKTNVTFIGEDVEETILTFDDYSSKTNQFGEELGTTGSSSFFLFGDDFTAKNITFQNSAGRVGQAVALRVNGDRAVFINCRFLGDQDTLYTHGSESRQYYKDSYIEGTTDFIFGSSTAVFENCEIVSKKKKGSYITAASTPEGKAFGYVFINSRFTAKPDVAEQTYYLGRPWRPHAKVVLINSYLDSHIRSSGWHNWNDPAKEETVFYAEFENEGTGFHPEKRVKWSAQLTTEEASAYTLETIFNGWNPLERIE